MRHQKLLKVHHVKKVDQTLNWRQLGQPTNEPGPWGPQSGKRLPKKIRGQQIWKIGSPKEKICFLLKLFFAEKPRNRHLKKRAKIWKPSW